MEHCQQLIPFVLFDKYPLGIFRHMTPSVLHWLLLPTLLISIVCFTGCSTNSSTPPEKITNSSARVASKKWHPGHYAGLMTLKMPKELLIAADIENFDIKDLGWNSDALDAFIASLPAEVVGIEIGVTWRMLEKAEDHYDFSFIETALTICERYSKHLFVHVSERSFTQAVDPAPDYIKKSNGVLNSEHWDGGGDIAMIWKPTVAQRYYALIKALGIAFNDKPHFEGITFPESALGSNANATVLQEIEWSDSDYLNYMISRVDTAQYYFPDCVIFQGLNWGPVEALIDHAIQVGAGVYGPDLEPDSSLRTDTPVNRIQAYEQIELHSGVIPMGMDVQEPEYLRSSDKLVDVTAQKIFDMGVETLKLNYIFWNVIEGEGLGITFDSILNVIELEGGRINITQPSF